MNVNAWAQQRVQYSRARRGRNERGAQLGECALVEAMALALGRRALREERLASLPVRAEGRSGPATRSEGRSGPATRSEGRSGPAAA